MKCIINDFRFLTTTKVAWGDMDAFQHVNNSIFFKYFENVRIAYLEKAKILVPRANVLPILADISCKFISPLYYPDVIILAAKVTEFSEDRFVMNYGIFNEQSKKCSAFGSSSIVSFDYQKKKKVLLPDTWISGIKDIET